MKVLVLGASGMLGNAVARTMGADPSHEVVGTVRSTASGTRLAASFTGSILPGVDVLDHDALVQVVGRTKPNVVINCVGLVKQFADASDPLAALPINSLFPHRLARLCALSGARVVHISTDCVFSGRTGNYREDDPSDAEDLYGKSKYIGELHDYPHAITLRTSIIGHELSSRHGLVEWFLSQEGQVRGFAKAIFSGLPTVELSRIIRDVIVPSPDLCGLYHVSAAPISKLELIRLVASAYGKDIAIVPDDHLVIDRSLDSQKFTDATGYRAPKWPSLINQMHEFR